MASLPPLHGAFPLDASDDSRLFFSLDTTQVQSRALDDVPANFLSMVDLSWAVEYAQSGWADDQLDLAIRIMNGATVLAAADSGGTFQTVATNIQNTVETTAGPTAFTYVNTGADKATWDGASIELEQTFTANMMSDGCRIFVDFVELTGTFAGSEQITHTTDLRAGIFVSHTTDLNISEFQVPTATYPASSRATKMGIDDNGTVWMVGLNGTLNVRLWEGPASGPGFWQLHEHTHGSGVIRDVGMAIIEDRIHVVYSYHSGSTMRQWHIVWNSTTQSWTDNGSFGPSESHSDSTVSNRNAIGIAATSDGELVALSYLHNYVNFGGSTAYRLRVRLTRSVDEDFPTTGVLFREFYGDNIFDPPFNIVEPRIASAANGSVIIDESNRYTFFDSAGNFSETFPRPEESQSLPVIPSTGTGTTTTGIGLQEHFHNNRYYRYVNPHNSVGYISAADNSDDELLFDEGELLNDYSDLNDNPRGRNILLDDHGQVGAALYVALANPPGGTKGRLIVSKGVGWFVHEFDSPVGSPADMYRAERLVDGAYSAWHPSSGGDWTFFGTTLPYRQIAHTADMIVSNKPVVTHTTDLFLSSGMWGSNSVQTRAQNPRKIWIEYSSSHYLVTAAPFSTDANRHFSLYLFETSDVRNPGTLISTLHISDLPNATQVSKLKAWDMVHVNGVLHFVLAAWISSRVEFHHSEYDIDTDTWTHHGLFDNGTAISNESEDAVAIAERGNGDLVAFVHFDNDFGSPSQGGFHYALNDGGGFGAGVQMADPGWSTSVLTAGIAVDGDDVHFFSDSNHMHLSSTDVLGVRQFISPVYWDDYVIRFYPSSKPLVHNGTMYVAQWAQTGSKNVQVNYASTGEDEPTWNTAAVSTRDISNLAGFLVGPGGLPTLVYVEKITWKIWKATLESGTWVERDTGQTLPVNEYDLAADGTNDDNVLYLSEIDANNFVHLWWLRRQKNAADLSYLGGERWYPYHVNLNPLVVHTTDVVLSPAPLKVTHTTDVIASLTSTVDHTTDLVTITGAGGTVSINHSTDLKTVDRASVAHTTDVHAAFVVDLTHTTDLHIVATPHDLSVTITLPFSLTVVLEEGYKPEGTGLGVPRDGDQIPRIYKPTHKVISR